jgi:hypothetical protein
MRFAGLLFFQNLGGQLPATYAPDIDTGQLTFEYYAVLQKYECSLRNNFNAL